MTGPSVTMVFISYARADVELMLRVRAMMARAGIEAWTDGHLEPGTDLWAGEIEEAIGRADCVLCLLSPSAKQSTWVRREIVRAQKLGVPVVPVLVSGDATSAVPIELDTVQLIDATTAVETALDLSRLPRRTRSPPPFPRRPTPEAPSGPSRRLPTRWLRWMSLGGAVVAATAALITGNGRPSRPSDEGAMVDAPPGLQDGGLRQILVAQLMQGLRLDDEAIALLVSRLSADKAARVDAIAGLVRREDTKRARAEIDVLLADAEPDLRFVSSLYYLRGASLEGETGGEISSNYERYREIERSFRRATALDEGNLAALRGLSTVCQLLFILESGVIVTFEYQDLDEDDRALLEDAISTRLKVVSQRPTLDDYQALFTSYLTRMDLELCIGALLRMADFISKESAPEDRQAFGVAAALLFVLGAERPAAPDAEKLAGIVESAIDLGVGQHELEGIVLGKGFSAWIDAEARVRLTRRALELHPGSARLLVASATAEGEVALSAPTDELFVEHMEQAIRDMDRGARLEPSDVGFCVASAMLMRTLADGVGDEGSYVSRAAEREQQCLGIDEQEARKALALANQGRAHLNRRREPR